MASILESLWVRGACVRLQTSAWSGMLTLSPEDLGLLPEDVDARLIQMGRGWLIDKDSLYRLNNFRDAARHLRDALSVQFLPLPDLYYVPVGNLAKLEDGVNVLREKQAKAVEEFASSWERKRSLTLDRWRDWLGTAWARIDWENKVPAERRKTAAEFVDAGLARVQAALPTEAKLRRSWTITMTFLQLDVPRGTQGTVVSAAEAGAKLLAFERNRAEWEAEIQDFVGATAKALRERVAEVAARVAEFASRGELKGQSVTSLKKVLDEVSTLNFLGDADLDKAIGDLQKAAPQLDSAASLGDKEVLERLSAAVGGIAQGVRAGANKAAEDVLASFGRVGKRAVRGL